MKGTTFTAYFPVKKVNPSQNIEQKEKLHSAIQKSKESNPDLEPINPTAPILMVVEDEQELREHLAYILSSLYTVITASNGKEAIKLARERIPDVVLFP